MNKLLCRFACLAAFCLAASAQAAVLTFDPPVDVIPIDNVTNLATYSESGFQIAGVAASYLTLDGFGAEGSGGLFVVANSPIRLTAAGGGLFSLLGLDYAAFDTSDPDASLLVTGLVDGSDSLVETLLLNNLTFTSFSFQSWSNLTEVSFLATADFALDNIEALKIPEPASLALVSVALAGLTLARRRKPSLGQ